MRYHLYAAAVVLAIVTALSLANPAHAAGHVPACVTEDSAGPCHWDAAYQGNGYGRSFTTYRHHRPVTGRVALTLRQVRNVESIVHRLPECRPGQVTGCRVFLAHRHTLASFTADGRSYFARMHRGQLAHAEVYA